MSNKVCWINHFYSLILIQFKDVFVAANNKIYLPLHCTGNYRIVFRISG